MTAVFFTESSRNMGGQEYQLLDQAQGLKSHGYTPYILCRQGSRVGEEALKRGLLVEWVPFRNAAHPPSLWRVSRLLRKHQPVAVVCHSGHDSNVSALAVHALAGLSCLPYRPRLIRMRTYQAGPAKAYTYNQLFDVTFTPSEALRDQLLTNRAIDPARVAVMYPGVDFDQITEQASPMPDDSLSRVLSDRNKRPLIVHAAMFRLEKGHSFMLDVIELLRAEFPGLTYLAAGEGELLESFRDEVKRRGLIDHVVMPGTVKPIAPLLARADVVVMPSTYEPLGMSQIEALGLETPVVVSKVGGLPETVTDGHTGTVCPPPFEKGAAEQWANALRQVFLAPLEAKRMAMAGSVAVRAQFGRQSNLTRLVEQFKVPRLQAD